MKKAIVALLLSICAQAYAESACTILKISVKNDSPSTCYLIQRQIKSGTIYRRQLYRIAPGAKVTQFEMLQGRKMPASILLTYECGENHTISFLSTKDACFISTPGKVEGRIVSATNMDAVFTTSEGGYLKPGSIDWVIS